MPATLLPDFAESPCLYRPNRELDTRAGTSLTSPRETLAAIRADVG